MGKGRRAPVEAGAAESRGVRSAFTPWGAGEWGRPVRPRMAAEHCLRVISVAARAGVRSWPRPRGPPVAFGAAGVSAGAAWFARGGRGSVLDPASARALGLTRGALSRSCGHDLTLRLPVPPWHERRAARDNGTRAHRAPLRGAGCCARTDRVCLAATRLTRSLGAGRRQTPHPPAGHSTSNAMYASSRSFWQFSPLIKLSEKSLSCFSGFSPNAGKDYAPNCNSSAVFFRGEGLK